MDITPMIDVTFLLLIFFTVASKVDTGSKVELPPARHGTAVSGKNSVVITLTRGEGGLANIFRGDTTDPGFLLTSHDAAVQELEIASFVRDSMRADGLKEHVLIRADRDVLHGDVARVLRALRQLDEVPTYVAVIEERES
jgi:biopolymer transport protein ExbD